MKQKTVEHALKMLEALAKKLGTTADKLWAVLVKQVRIDALTSLGQLSIYIATLFVLLPYIPTTTEKFSEALIVIMWGAFAVASIIALIWTLDTVGVLITGFLNPEYKALNHVMDYFKPESK